MKNFSRTVFALLWICIKSTQDCGAISNLNEIKEIAGKVFYFINIMIQSVEKTFVGVCLWNQCKFGLWRCMIWITYGSGSATVKCNLSLTILFFNYWSRSCFEFSGTACIVVINESNHTQNGMISPQQLRCRIPFNDLLLIIRPPAHTFGKMRSVLRWK